MPTTEITKAVGQAIADAFEGVDGIKAYLWDRMGAGLDSLPCVVIGLPGIRRRDPDAPESEMHSTDRTYEYPIWLYVKANKSVSSQDRMAQLIDLVIAAIDDNPSLGIVDNSFRVEDAVLQDLEPSLLENQKGDPVLWEYTGVVSVTSFVL